VGEEGRGEGSKGGKREGRRDRGDEARLERAPFHSELFPSYPSKRTRERRTERWCCDFSKRSGARKGEEERRDDRES